jgi:hypothetical protein
MSISININVITHNLVVHSHTDTPTRARRHTDTRTRARMGTTITTATIFGNTSIYNVMAPGAHSFISSSSLLEYLLSVPQWSLDSVVTRLGEIELSLERFEVVCVACSDQVHPIHKRECSPQIIPDVHCLRVEIQPSEVVLTGIVVVALVHE